MDIHIVTYNMGMGASRDKGNPIIARSEVVNVFASGFYDLWSTARDAVWFLCVQEIDLNYDDHDQLEELQEELGRKTGKYWHKRSKTHPGSDEEEAVAIYCVEPFSKYKKLDIGDDRTAIAVKVELPQENGSLWVTNTHLIAGKSDPDGTKREEELGRVLQELVTFDGSVPMVLVGDFNVTDYVGSPDAAFDEALYDQTIGKLERFGYMRGFTPQPSDFTFPAWATSSDSTKIIDYIFLLNGGGLAPRLVQPVVPDNPNPNITKIKDGKTLYASDHRGVYMKLQLGQEEPGTVK